MKNRNCLQILVKSTIAAALLVQSSFADAGNHSMLESCAIRAGERVNCSLGGGCGFSQSGSTTLMAVDRQLDVSLTENGQVRIAWDAALLDNGTLQVSDNYADWTEVPNARNPFFTPINHKVNTYFRVVYDLSDGTRNTPPEDFGNIGMLGGSDGSGIIKRGVFGVDDNPGPDLFWADEDGDGLVDGNELTEIAAKDDGLIDALDSIKGIDGESVPVPIEWLEDILDRISLIQGDGGTGHGVGIIVSVNPAFGADTFRNRLEHGPGLHDSIHCIVGGTMCSARSSNDPVFFTHHANLDGIIEGETQDLLIALVDFPDDLSGIVSTMLHDTSMAVIRKMGGEINDGNNDSAQDGYPVLIHGIAAADSPIEGFWIAPSVEVSALAGTIASNSLHNNGAFLPWHRGHITFPDDLGPPGGFLQENRDPVPALMTGIWTKSSGTRLADDLDLLLNHLWHDAIPEGDDINAGDPARLVMLDTGPISLGSLGSNGWSGMDVGPVGAEAQPFDLVMRDGAGNAIGREGAVYLFHRENNDGNLSRQLHDSAMAVIRKIGAAPEGGSGGGGGRVVVRAASLQNDPGSDPVQGVVVEIDTSSPKIAEQALSGDEASADDIGMVRLEIDKSSPKIAEAILKAGESLAEEHFVVILDTTTTAGDELTLPMAFAGPAAWLQSRLGIGSEHWPEWLQSHLGIGSEHWPEPALEGEEAGLIFIIPEEQGEELSLDLTWGFPQNYDAMRNRLEHGSDLLAREHLIIRGALVAGIWTDGTFSSIRQGEANVENNVELSDAAEQGLVEILEIMKTKHDTAKAAINNVR